MNSRTYTLQVTYLKTNLLNSAFFLEYNWKDAKTDFSFNLKNLSVFFRADIVNNWGDQRSEKLEKLKAE